MGGAERKVFASVPMYVRAKSVAQRCRSGIGTAISRFVGRGGRNIVHNSLHAARERTLALPYLDLAMLFFN